MCGIKWGLGTQVLISLLLSDDFFFNGAFFYMLMFLMGVVMT